jgi:protein-tyrosine phosphatase
MMQTGEAPIPRILFVCLGNICRSPMAEGALRHLAAERGIALEIDSAGTGNWHRGHPPDRRAQATAGAYGVDICGLRARQVKAGDFHAFDYVVAMDGDNYRNLERLRPRDGTAQLLLMLDHLPGREGEGVTDPYYGGDDGFHSVWRDIMGAANGLLDRIVRDRRAINEA